MWDSYRQSLFTLVMHGYVPILLCTRVCVCVGWNLEWRGLWFRHSEDPCLLMFSFARLLPPARMYEREQPCRGQMRTSCVYMGCFSVSI